jgi:5-hydroxyisourate hydrolase-like protein (transthyretin family)
MTSRATSNYEFVRKAENMKSRGMPLAEIKVALMKMAVNEGHKGATVTETPGRFELKLTSRDKIVFDGKVWEAVTDLD